MILVRGHGDFGLRGGQHGEVKAASAKRQDSGGGYEGKHRRGERLTEKSRVGQEV